MNGNDAVSERLGAVVANCELLTVYEEPNETSEIVMEIPIGAEVMIDLTTSTDTFYKICNAAGIEGYCKKQFIESQA